MHVTSTLNSNTKSLASLPVAVFSYEGKRKFVVKSKEYNDTITYVKAAFGIPQEADVALSTVSLDVCRGQAVEIDELAYPHLWEVLDELVITASDSASTNAQPIFQPKGKARASIPNKKPISSARSSHAHEPPSSSTKPTPRLSSISPAKAAAGPAPQRFDEAVLANIVREVEAMEELEVEHQTKAKAKSGPPIDKLFDDSDEEVEEAVNPQHELPEFLQEVESRPSTPSPKPKKSRPVPKPAALTPVPAKKEKTEGKKPKFKPSSTATGSILPKSKASGSASAAAPVTRDATPPPAPPQTAPPAQALASPAHASEAEPMDENTRFTILIQGPGDELSAQFKMRGKHPIYKILKTACSNFGLDVSRATLWLVHDDEDDEHCYQLGMDKTVLQCGIRERSRLIIQIDGDEGEEEEEEEEE